jgi:hypothetical protein
MRSLTAALLLSEVLLPFFVSAQATRQKEGKPLQPPNFIQAGDANGQLIIIGFTLASLPSMPLSGTIESEIQTVDTHGSSTVTRHAAKIFRDVCGSLRTETDINAIGAPTDARLINVQIYDSTSKTDINLVPWNKSAFVMEEEDHSSPPDFGESPCLLQPLQKRGDPVRKHHQDPKLSPQSSSPLSYVEPKSLGFAGPSPTQPDIHREELGVEVLDGMSLRHGRETVNYPAGFLGEKNAYAIVTDYWYSQELQAFVLIKQVGPKNIVQTLALRNITCENPVSSLFKIPKGYTIHKMRMSAVETQNTL